MNAKIVLSFVIVVMVAWTGTSLVKGQSFDDEDRSPDEFSSTHISNFISIAPLTQNTDFQYPTSHRFQYLVEEGVAYSDNSGTFSDKFDFTGFVPMNGSSEQGVLGINHELIPGGVSMMDISLDSTTKKWTITDTQAVDFSGVLGTAANCSGTVTPWETYVSCEEFQTSLDLNFDGYNDAGWCIEIDPSTRTIIDQNGGLDGPDKLWAMGNFQHENLVINPTNLRTVYTGLDRNTGYLFRFVADVASDLSSGRLQVLKMTSTTDGEWVTLDNTTQAERNSTIAQAAAVGATVYNGVEDVEIGPDGLIYFAVKNEDRVYRFRDDDPLNGTTVSQFETYVGGASYDITHAGGVTSTPWGSGNDNLAFDDLGNLWVNQDGGNNYIWVVEAGHTQLAPKVKIFGIAPAGSESTGITFTPDFKYMFLSIQHPSAANSSTSQLDAFGTALEFDKDVAIVMTRAENPGAPTSVENVTISAEPPSHQLPYSIGLIVVMLCLTSIAMKRKLYVG